MLTLKIRYNMIDDFDIETYQHQYSSCLHFVYNRIYDNPTISEIELRKQYDNIRNRDLISKWMFQCCIKEAKQIYDSNKENKVIFGGKKNFFQRLKSNISKQEYKTNRLSPIYSIGEESKLGNRLFRLQNDMSIIFQPNRNQHYKIQLVGIGKNRLRYLSKLVDLQNRKEIGITYKLDKTHVYIIFDESKVMSYDHNKIKDRILAIDMNPNYIGYSIVDWKSSSEYNIIYNGCYSFKEYDNIENEMMEQKLASTSAIRKHIVNKHKYDMIDICKNIVDKAIYYKCDKIGMEDLNIKSGNKGAGRKFNKLCNNKWIRGIFVSNLSKRCNINNIKLVKVKPEYSSFIGNIIFRQEKLFDPILSSIEIGRRAYEYNSQYIDKLKTKIKNIVFPIVEHFYDSYVKSMEEFGIKEKFTTWINLYKQIKEAKIMYRFSLDQSDLKLFRFKSSLVYCYN